MFKTVNEQEFLVRTGSAIKYIGIYELDWLLDDNQLDCEGLIVVFEDKQYLIQSKAIGEDDFEFFYYEFNEDYECRKILSSPEEPISFIRKEKEETSYRALRFQIGERPIVAMAIEDGLMTIGISHWDINDDWLEFENNNLLNDD